MLKIFGNDDAMRYECHAGGLPRAEKGGIRR